MQILIYLSNETSIANSYGGGFLLMDEIDERAKHFLSPAPLQRGVYSSYFREVYSELKHPLQKGGGRWYETPEGKQKVTGLREIETREMFHFPSPVV